MRLKITRPAKLSFRCVCNSSAEEPEANIFGLFFLLSKMALKT